MFPRSRGRRGVAIAIALAALVLIGALVGGVLFAVTQEYRIGRNTLLQARALTAAEYGLNRAITPAEWQAAWNGGANGAVFTVGYAPGAAQTDTVRVTKIGAGMFFLASEGRAGSVTGGQARHRVGVLVALRVPTINFLGALTSRGAVKVGGSSLIAGADATYTGWGCPPAGASVPALVVPDTTQITTSGCKNYSCLSGSQKIKQDPAAGADSTYFKYGDSDWNSLAAMATSPISGGATLTGLRASVNADGTCNIASSSNWGDPYGTTPALRPCTSYFPVIYSKGDLHISGGYGQGILMVEGDLDVTGGFEFFGAVIVKGHLKTTGTGGHFNGGVLAANVDLEQTEVLGNAVINYSRCVVAKALAGSGSPGFARGRAWVELF